MTTFPLPENALPGLDPLLNGDLWQRWADAGRVFPVPSVRAAIGYLRLKPDSSCRVTIFGEESSDAGIPQGRLVHLFPSADRAEEKFHKEVTQKEFPDGFGEPLLHREAAAVVFPFPCDPELPDLHQLYDPVRFRRALMEALADYPEDQWRVQRQLLRTQLLVYKPGRRAVLRVKVKLRHREEDRKARVLLHAKWLKRTTADRCQENLVAIHGACPAGASWRTAVPCGAVEDFPLMAAHWVEGDPLWDRIAAGGDGAVSSVRAAAQALAGCHALDLPLDHLDSPIEQAERLMQQGRDLASLLPAEQDSILHVADRLARGVQRLSLSSSVIAHGDFHPGQVLLADAQPVLVDLDQAGRGYAANDLGSFLAHWDEHGADPDLQKHFLHAYESAARALGQVAALDPDVVQVARGAALFARASFSFRALHPEWPARVVAQVERCGALLDEVGR